MSCAYEQFEVGLIRNTNVLHMAQIKIIAFVQNTYIEIAQQNIAPNLM